MLPEVTEVPEEEDHPKTPIDIIPTNHLAVNCITSAPVVASPAVFPTASPIVHLPISLTNLVADTSPSSIPRTALRSFLQP